MPLNLVFLGTGHFAVPSLKALVDAGHRVQLVICQPDRPSGRGHQVHEPAVKVQALALGLDVFQPERLREPFAVTRALRDKPDALAVVAYGQILPTVLLETPRLGGVNVHGSLLPRWRGAAPIQWALAHGDAVTGVCTQRMVAKLDAGAVYLNHPLAIAPDDDSDTLFAKLAPLGAALLLDTLRGLEEGTLQALPQDESQVTLAPLIKKEDGHADFTLEAKAISQRWRAFKASPGFRTASAKHGGLKIIELRVGREDDPTPRQPGQLVRVDEALGLEVACAAGQSVWLSMVQPENGKAMGGAAYAHGRALVPGDRFWIEQGS